MTPEEIQRLCRAAEGLLKKCSSQEKQIDRLLRRPPLQRLYVTKVEAACLMGISPRKVERMIEAGALSTLRDSKAVMLSVRELETLPLIKSKGGLPQEELQLDCDAPEADDA